MRTVDDVCKNSKLFDLCVSLFFNFNLTYFFIAILKDYSFINSSFNEVFVDINEICVLTQFNDIYDINFELHQCVIYEDIPYENGLYFDEILTINDNYNHVLHLVMTINPQSETKYNSKIHSRHGGLFKKWWLQEENEKKLIPNSN